MDLSKIFNRQNLGTASSLLNGVYKRPTTSNDEDPGIRDPLRRGLGQEEKIKRDNLEELKSGLLKKKLL